MASSSAQPLVMVVDDDDPTRMMATEFLSQAGFSVVDYPGADAALSELESQNPDLIVLDVEMPGVDGFTACKRIRALESFTTTPVLMLTGLNNNDSIDLAFEAGATDFATKPINWTLLCHRLRYMLRAWQASEDLVNNQKSLAAAQRIAKLGNCELNTQSGEMYWSDQLYAIFGTEKTDKTPSVVEFLSFVHQKDRARVSNWLNEVYTAPSSTSYLDFSVAAGCGTERFVRLQIEQVLDKEGKVDRVSGVIQDFTEKRRAEHRIEQLAYYDSVTDLPNRTLFQSRLDDAIQDAKRDEAKVAVLYVDIDDFKSVNDSLGHATGDVMLNEIASRISQDVGDSKTTVSRMGADEFTVLLPAINDVNEAEALAEKVGQTLASPYTINDSKLFSSASIGISVFPEHGDCAETVIKSADMAMSGAKRAGKNTVLMHDDAMGEEAKKRFRIESNLRSGLERNEFDVYFQPQIDLMSGKLYSAEALIRWNSDELGFVPPNEFISIAEDNGFIIPLGEWVLRTSCLQAVNWLKDGFPISQVAVNISVLQFIRPDFPDTVRRILQETRLQPSFLELEITESLLATDTAQAVQTLRALKEIGVQLSIDDFGTGYSSLSQLKHFPIDRLKLDQSFVQGVTTSEEDAAITRAVIAMTNSMDVKLLAEGVETLEQLEFLKHSNCNEIQGYYISKPMSAGMLEQEINDVESRLDGLFDGHGNLRLAA